MSLRIDKLQLDLIVNGDSSRQELMKLQKEAAEVRKSMRGIKDQDLLGKKQQELNTLESKMEDIRQSIGVTGMSMKELSQRSSQLNAILRNMNPNHAEFSAYQQELRTVRERMHDLSVGAKVTKESLAGVTTNKFSLAGMVAGGMAAYSMVTSVFSGIKNGIISSIEAYREQEVAIQKVEQAIKQTGGAAGLSLKQLTDEANRLQSNTLFGDEEILNKATAQLLTFTNITGSTFLKAQQAAMDLSTVLDGDLQASSIQLGKALSDPVSGLTSLRKVGVLFTDDQKKLIKELAETNRLEEAQGIILNEVNRQYGGQAEAVAKGSGAMKQAGIQLGEIAESIGGFLAKLITPFAAVIAQAAKGLNELIGPSKSAVDTFEEHGRSVAVLVTEINPLLDRYDQLKSKTTLSAGEQAEMKKIIGQVTAVMPGAASAFDKYGNAIEITTQRVRDNIKGQVLLLRLENKSAIDETISDLADVNVAIAAEKKKMDEIAKTGSFKVFEPKSKMGAKTGQGDEIRDANQTEIAATQRHYQELVNKQVAYNAKISNLRGDALEQSVLAYNSEKNAARDAAAETINYKTASMEELKDLSLYGNDTQKEAAKKEITIREDLKKNAAEYAAYLKKISEELESARVQSMKEGREKELKMEELTFQKKLSAIKGNSDLENQLRTALEDEHQTKRAAILNKYIEKEKDEVFKTEQQKWELKLNGLVEGSMEWFNVSQEMLERQRENELNDVELTEQQKLNIEEKYRIARENLNKKPEDSQGKAGDDDSFQAEWEATKMRLERTGQMTTAMKKKMAEQERDIALAEAGDNVGKIQLIWEQYYAKLKELNMEWILDVVAGLSSLVNSFSGFDQALTQYEQAQLQRDQTDNETKKANLKKQLDSKQISQAQYNESVAKMDADLAAKKRKIAHDEAVRQKAISIVQAIINTAQGITAAITVPYVGLALAVVAGVLGAAQIALIASTPIPEAAKGRYGALKRTKQAANGSYDVIGQDDGKLYRDVPYESSFTGIPGRPLLVNETGNEIIIDPYTTRNLQMNYPDVIQAIYAARVPQRAIGSYPVEIVKSSQSPNETISTRDYNLDLVNAIRSLNQHIENGIHSKIVWSEFEDAQKTIDIIESDVSR